MWNLEPDVGALRADQSEADVLGNSVAFPTPVPAVGTLLLGKTPPDASSSKGPISSPYYFRIVEQQSPRMIVSRYFDSGPARNTGALLGLIGVLPASLSAATPDSRPVFTNASDSAFVAGLDKLKDKISDAGAAGETLVAKAAVVFVQKTAEVQVRIDFMASATEAAELIPPFFCPPCTIPCHPLDDVRPRMAYSAAYCSPCTIPTNQLHGQCGP
jgi:hypothetical protein